MTAREKIREWERKGYDEFYAFEYSGADEYQTQLEARKASDALKEAPKFRVKKESAFWLLYVDEEGRLRLMCAQYVKHGKWIFENPDL